MGVVIKAVGATFTYNVNDEDIEFDIFSDHAINISFVDGVLSLQTSVSANYEHAATRDLVSATIATIDVQTNDNALVIGKLTDGGVAVVYFTEAPGRVDKFPKNGLIGGIITNLYQMPTPPTVPFGSAVTITHSSDRVTISYSGYSHYILYSSIPGWSYPVIGVLATGNTANTYRIEF